MAKLPFIERETKWYSWRDRAAAKCVQEKLVTVLAHVARQRMPDDFSNRCEQIDLANELIAGDSHGNLPRPAMQRDAQPAFEEVGLVAVQRPTGMMPQCDQLVELRFANSRCRL